MKNVILSILLVMFTSSVFAGSCPMMAKNIDAKIEEAQKLRDAGMKAHESGDHAKSEELLNQALELINNDKPIDNLKQNFDKNEISSSGLLSVKPKLYVCNVDEDSIQSGNKYTEQRNRYFVNSICNLFSGPHALAS